MGATDDAADLSRRAQNLRDAAREARSVARSLGPYLDDAVSKAGPRADNPRGPAGDAIWLGPYADQCTNTLTQRQSKLGTMAYSLLVDATRWENEASKLEGEAKKAKNAKNPAAAGGH